MLLSWKSFAGAEILWLPFRFLGTLAAVGGEVVPLFVPRGGAWAILQVSFTLGAFWAFHGDLG